MQNSNRKMPCSVFSTFAIAGIASCFLCAAGLQAQTQVNPSAPCVSSNTSIGNYGYGSQQSAIDKDAELPMDPQGQTTNETTYVNAIHAGENTKGTFVGCPSTSYSYESGDNTAPTLKQAQDNWNTNHAPYIAQYSTTCPDIGRNGASYALATYWAGLGGIAKPQSLMLSIADMQVAEQLSSANVSGTLTNPGGFGYLNSGSAGTSDPCFLSVTAGTTTLGADVTQNCKDVPSACVTFTSGTFAGKNFQVQDIGDLSLVPDGSMDYDQGWDGVALVETTIQEKTAPNSTSYNNALTLAGQWAINEPAVRDVNYTAKLVWLLANLYDRTGNTAYYTSMMNKLNRGLLINELMPDPNNAANVNGMSPAMPFSSLTPLAQTPGRMYDGHNSLPGYAGMNVWALVEAYVALRDQGKTTDAANVRPYAIAALNNMAHEINVLGVPDTGKSQYPMALMLGLWKIEQYENLADDVTSKTSWQNAAWKCWNNGTAKNFGAETPNAALYLLYLSGTKFKPLSQR